MTLIAFHTSESSATVVSDSWSYDSMGRIFTATTKVTPMLHLDAVAVTQGDSLFGKLWAMEISRPTPDDIRSLDELRARRDIPALLAGAEAERDRLSSASRHSPSWAFLIGFSEHAQRFVAYAYDSAQDYEEVEVAGLFVTPAPFSAVQPHPLEMRRLQRHFRDAARWSDPDEARIVGDELLSALATLPPLGDAPVPTTAVAWAGLAEAARQDRSMTHPGTGHQVFVGGDLHCTRLERGLISQELIYRFDDSIEELSKIMRGSLNDLGLSLPCIACDSGLPFGECHVQLMAAAPCPCGSGQPLHACCLAGPGVSPLRADS